MPPQIDFCVEEGGTPLPPGSERTLREWILRVVQERNGTTGPLTYIFCGDEYLHRLNVEYLHHDTLTDIITFPYGDFPVVSGDLFISTDRVAENARDRQLSYVEELHRVIIHGVLHLCGQGDKTEVEAQEMRRLEDWALSIRAHA